jgi:hypothetical protein
MDFANNQNSSSRSYTNLFPSSFLTYHLNNESSWRLSISRRIQRPRRDHILPFNSFSDSRNIVIGNPEINPSFVRLAEIGYQTRINSRLSITPTLFIRSTREMIQYFVQEKDVLINGLSQEVFVARPENVGDNQSVGFEVNISYLPFQWLRLYNETRITSFKQEGRVFGKSYNSKGTYVYGRLNMSYILSESLKFQIQHRYVSRRKRGQIDTDGIYRMDLGLSMTMFHDNATLSLSMKDIFDTWEWHVTRSGDGFVQEIDNQVRTPQFSASFIYLFNQQKYTGNKGRQYDRI